MFVEGCWTDLHSKGSQEVHWGQVGGDFLSRGSKQRCRHSCLAALAQWKRHTGKTRRAIARSTVLLIHHRLQHDYGCALTRQQSHANVQVHKSLFGQNLAKTTTESQLAVKSWANVVHGDPTKDMTVVPPPATVESQVTRREPMDLHGCFSVTGPGPRSSRNIAFSRVTFLADGHVKFWRRPSHPSADLSLSLAKDTNHRVSGHCHTAPDAHVINAVDDDNSWTARRTDPVPPGRSHGDESRRQQRRRRIRRTRWLLMRTCIERWSWSRLASQNSNLPGMRHIEPSPHWCRGWAPIPRRRPWVLAVDGPLWVGPHPSSQSLDVGPRRRLPWVLAVGGLREWASTPPLLPVP